MLVNWLIWCVLWSSAAVGVDSDWLGDTEAYGAYYENLEWDYRIEDDMLSVEVTGSLLVLNSRGQWLSKLSVWENPHRRVDRVKIEVSNASGKKVYSRGKKDMTKVSGFGSAGVLYSDVRRYLSELPSPGYPYTIKYRYRIRSDNLFQPEPAVFQRSVPVKIASCRLTLPKDYPFFHKVYGLSIAPLVTESKNKMSYEWRIDGVKPLSRAGYLPEDGEVPARIEFMPEQFSFEGYNCGGRNWDVIGLWYRSLAEDRYLLESLPRAQDSLDLDAQQTIRLAYERVVDNNRYVAVEIGIGGWQPHFASWTEEHGYGDCKDLTTLLISYLQLNDIQSYPVLVTTRGNGVLDPQFPSLNFNHLITMAVSESDTVWMDPTCNLCAFGDLPYSDEGIYGLAVTDSGGVIVRVPSSTPQQNVIHRETNLRVRPDKTVKIDLQVTATGNPAQYLRSRLRIADRLALDKLARLLCCGDLNSSSINAIDLLSLEDTDQPLEISIEALTIRPISSLNNILYLKTIPRPLEYGYDTLNYENRLLPISLGYADSSQEDITITWDTALHVDSAHLPTATSISCEYAVWNLTSASSGDTAKISITDKTIRNQVPVEGFSAYQDFVDSRREARRKHVSLHLAE